MPRLGAKLPAASALAVAQPSRKRPIGANHPTPRSGSSHSRSSSIEAENRAPNPQLARGSSKPESMSASSSSSAPSKRRLNDTKPNAKMNSFSTAQKPPPKLIHGHLKFESKEEAERNRKTRMEYRQLIGTLDETKIAVMETGDIGKASEKLDASQKLYQHVAAPQEGALDSQFLLGVSEIGLAHTQRLHVGCGGGSSFGLFRVEDFSRRVADAMDRSKRSTLLDFGRDIPWHQSPRIEASGDPMDTTGSEAEEASEDMVERASRMDFERLGCLAERCLDKAEGLDTILENLTSDWKRRTVVRRRRNEGPSGPLVVAREVRMEELESNAMTETTQNVRTVADCLRRRCRESPGRRVPLHQFVTNPHSFSETVENLFYVSFLVKDRKAFLWKDGKGTIWVFADELPSRGGPAYAFEQICVNLDFEEFHQRIEHYKITSSMIPSRS